MTSGAMPRDSGPHDTAPYDLVVVGGGPAGVAGALTAALAGLRVARVDSGPRLGGQYFRHPAVPGRAAGLDRFLRQARALGARADVLLRHQVWAASREPDGDLLVHCTTRNAAGTSREERAVVLRARRLLIATGAHDRPLPFPGWDLPGVLTAGGAQALLKGGGVVAGRRIVVSGTGPFLLPVASGLAGAGARVLGVYEANGGLGLARHPLLALGKAGEAAGYAAALARHRVPYRTRQAVVAAHGEHEVEAVTVARLDRDWNVTATHVVECDTLAVGYGFVPQIELGTQLGCQTRHDVDGSPVLTVDTTLRTTVPGVWAAGEPVGVGGWRLAELEGRLAGRAIIADARTSRTAGTSGIAGTFGIAGTASAPGTTGASSTAGTSGSTGALPTAGAQPSGAPAAGANANGAPATSPDVGDAPSTGADVGGARAARVDVGGGEAVAVVPPVFARRRERWRAFGEALQRAYPVKPGWQGWLRDDTLVCRCEEVPLARVREAQALGATDARSVKLLARPGMGWCQGRICGYAVSCLAGERPQPPRRPIAQPVTLGALASLAPDGALIPGSAPVPDSAPTSDSGPGSAPASGGAGGGAPDDHPAH
ncbi:FAD-dependent oxidoreductase [Nonomuraea sp. FMUSA5-5]|uniref:FAD-dependent oxidoreductase n=1 Tax=Nonomuraea composti TaxID=2720023 RepID=A0ABX1B644_9ACTN|nr:FAD-dependent oxidoreductase [Nonomuraea sp. FMUSA5-5]NJP91231.1 FAD-dependent oxidoreductase [Nonomuraea sp. FMUSA5-5]